MEKEVKRYYLDTSIWLDLFEKRKESSLNKYDFVKKLIERIIKDENKIVLSEVIKNEMLGLGYSRYDIESLFFPLRKIIIFVYSNKKQFGKAKDISRKIDVPLFDVLHAIIARDYHAILISRDKHFEELKDITIAKKPEEFI